MAPFEPDPRQLEVLGHTDGAMLVSGGSGTGKTAVLRERFARLIEGGADPERVALVVGSRRARDEARRLLLERLPVALPSLTVVTIHGLAFHVVGERFERLGYDAPPAVLSASEQFARVRELLDGEDPERWPVFGPLLKLRGFADEVRQLVIRAQEALRSPDDLERRAAERGLAGWNELAAFLRHYLSVLDASSEVDFAGLVEQAAVAAGAGDPPFDHVMVDDYQDTTFAAERLLAEIRPRTLVAAGDLAAHLFSFQGTTDEPLRRFAERNPAAASVALETRHRPEPSSTHAWRAGHVSEQHAAVARELRRLHVDDQIPWRELAVVVRRHGPRVEGLLRALDDAHVPRRIADAGSPAAVPATRPFVLALRWLVAGPQERDALIEPVLTSELGRLSPASVRSLLRLARAHGRPPRDALAMHDLSEPEDAEALTALAGVLARADAVAASVLDAFRVLWLELPFAADLVERAESDPHALVDLEAVVELSNAVASAGTAADPSTEAFLLSLGATEGAPILAAGDEGGHDGVHVLTAHAAAGREFDTVLVLDALEGDFPSLSRPEPMFDLATLDGAIARSEINRRRLADERRLFGMVRSRARRRVVLTATDPHGDESSVTLTSRFVEELGLSWRDVPSGPFAEPVSSFEAASAWRRGLGDPTAAPVERLACLDGLLALGDDPGRWWFQRDWTDLSAMAEDTLTLSYSRLSTLENCELQFVLSSELGLDPGGGYQAWVGKTVHKIIEGCERGSIDRTPEAFERALDEQWEKTRFPSYAVSEAERANAKTVLIRNWFERYAEPPATATERGFAFEFEGARIRGKIDRIGPVPEGGTRITDYKTGRSDSAPKPAESLQLGIYYLAVQEDDDLAEHRPVQAVELAFLGGKKADPALDVKAWSVSEEIEEEYQARMRERLAELIERIRELNEERRYVANTKASCFFCRFQTLCTRYPQGGAVFPIDGLVTAPAEVVVGS
ncbi:MAG TPA: ATP-dependent DNA helicase [Actinomycetota bacterium]|nr:ATP-dependent DNA helicase [Actinomycetota bacterium]